MENGVASENDALFGDPLVLDPHEDFNAPLNVKIKMIYSEYINNK